MNFDYKDAVPNTDISFEQFTPRSHEDPPLIDAVYVPTQAHRPVLETGVDVLKRHARNVYFLFSDDAAGWIQFSADPSIHIVRNMSADRKKSRFMAFHSARNPSSVHKPEYDIPYKRNIALGNAEQNGYKTICLLDDDIRLDDASLYKARQALHEGVELGSFHVLDYPDVSTIDHIERLIRQRPSRVSIGGNCLFLRMDAVSSFFPDAYNDDWYFIFKHIGHKRIATFGQTYQRPYQPWKDLDRVGFEQFGDIIIEGAKNNIKNGRPVFQGDAIYWQNILNVYTARLEELLTLTTEPVFVKAIQYGLEISRRLDVIDFLEFLKHFDQESVGMKFGKLKEAAYG